MISQRWWGPSAGSLCRHGHQCINRYFGGTLGYVEKESSGNVVHRGKESPYVKDCFHTISIKPGSRLAKGFGATRVVRVLESRGDLW